MRLWHMPTLSVVVSTYNRPKTIVRLLDVLNGQVRFNMKDLDVVVVDDGSPHRLDSELGKYHYAFKYIYRERHPDNMARVYSSRNMAVRESRGEYVLQLDDDVTFHERTLSELQIMCAMFDYLAPNLHWASFPRISNNTDIENEMGNDRAGWHRGLDGKWRDGKVHLMQVAWPSTTSCMMLTPRRTWELVRGYDEDFDGCMGAADQELALRIEKAGGYTFLGGYFAHIEDEETGSLRMSMINRAMSLGRVRNEDLMRVKHSDMDKWSEVDYWWTKFSLDGEITVGCV